MRQTEHKIYRIMVMSGDRHACKWFDATQGGGGGGGPSYERFSTGFLLLSLINGGVAGRLVPGFLGQREAG